MRAHQRAGASRYLVEPNVKEGKGGLRDLHTLFWIAKYVYHVREARELVGGGVFDAAEYRLFQRCDEFLVARALPSAFRRRAAPKSGCPSTFSARSRLGSAIMIAAACRVSSAS